MTKHDATGYNALRASLLSAAGVCAALACAGCSPSYDANTEARSSEVIWGNANLKNFENVSTVPDQENGTAVGLLTNESSLNAGSCPVPPTQTDCTWIMSTQPSGLCAGELFAPERSAIAPCTVFMIGPDRFATAAHCMTDLVAPWNGWDQECASRAVVMRWRTSSPTFPNGNQNIFSRHIYFCDSILDHGPAVLPAGPGLPDDWVVFRVDRPVTGGTGTGGPLTAEREPLFPTDAPPVVSSNNLVWSHTFGLPLKFDSQVAVASIGQQFPLNGGPGTFTIEADLLPGSSGAPVLTPAGRAFGMVIAGPQPVAVGGCFKDCFPTGQGAPTCTEANQRAIALDLRQLPRKWLPVAYDYDLDGARDDFLAFYEDNGTLWINIYIDGAFFAKFDTFLPVSQQQADKFSFVPLGDFDNDGVEDFVVVAGGQAIFFDANLTPWSFSLLTATYVEYSTGDADKDGFVDLELIREDGTRDLYFGSASGPTKGVPLSGFPTVDHDDGRFVTVTGQPFATVPNQRTRFLIGVPAGQSSLTVQAFDGDQALGSLYDTGNNAGARTCFALFSSKDKANPETVLPNTIVEDANLPDGSWGKIYGGPTFGTASGSGAHFYILDVYLTQGACGQPVVPVVAGLTNSFKVRATGQVSTVANDFAFIARDLSGPFSVGPLADTAMPDTKYDGVFRFFVDVGTASISMTLRDADADILTDDDPSVVGQRGPLDVKANGVATGASADIRYDVRNPTGAVVFTNINPSGNNDGATVTDEERLTVSVQNMPGAWEWRWQNLKVQNNVRIWAPVGSPVTYEVFGQPTRRLSPSGAVPVSTWLSRDTTAFLPISFAGLTVGSNSDAQVILSGAAPELGGVRPSSVSVCHLPPGSGGTKAKLLIVGTPALPAHLSHGDTIDALRLMASLFSELLATKLNIVERTAAGEDLAGAFVYTRDISVAAVVADAEAVLAARSACIWGKSDRDHAFDVLSLLRAINAGEVAYVAPDPAATAAPAAKKASKAQPSQQFVGL